MKGEIALCIICAVVFAAVDTVGIAKHGVDPDVYWPYVYSGVFMFWAFVARALDRLPLKTSATSAHTP